MTRISVLHVLAFFSVMSSVWVARADGHRVTIAAGEPGGSYRDLYAANLERLLKGYVVEVKSTTGSGENLDLLADGKVDLGFAQTDVYADLLLGNPERYASLRSLGTVAEECVYMAYRTDGAVTKFAHLASPTEGGEARLALGPASGGMRGTWRYMIHLQPALASAQVFDEGGTVALDRLVVGDYDAVGWVTDPNNRDHTMLKGVVRSDDLALLDLQDSSLVGALPNGVKVYERKRVKLADGWFAPKVQTICTSGRVLARSGASKELVDRVSDILARERGALARPRELAR